MSDSASTSAASGSCFATDKRLERMARLKDLHLKRNEARKQNHQEVVEEDKRQKLPSNWERRERRLKWEEEDDDFKANCLERGDDPDRLKALDLPADVAEKLEAKKRRKKNPDTGFADFEQASYRKYIRLTRTLRTDMSEYEKEKEKMGALIYPTKDTLGLHQRQDNPDAVERMAQDVATQAEKRAQYSRRRAYNDEADIDYINERNKRYNERLDRFYAPYTAEIKKNLERGTAI